jgi:hypothetical protein
VGARDTGHRTRPNGNTISGEWLENRRFDRCW